VKSTKVAISLSALDECIVYTMSDGFLLSLYLSTNFMMTYLNFNQFDNKVIFSFQITLKMDCLIEEKK
jgi:hypothetical protein